MKLKHRLPVWTYMNDYSVNNVSSSAWFQLIASLPENVTTVEIYDSSGQVIEFGYGPAGSEDRAVFIFPGGNATPVGLILNKGMRIVIRAVTGSPISTGILVINAYQ